MKKFFFILSMFLLSAIPACAVDWQIVETNIPNFNLYIDVDSIKQLKDQQYVYAIKYNYSEKIPKVAYLKSDLRSNYIGIIQAEDFDAVSYHPTAVFATPHVFMKPINDNSFLTFTHNYLSDILASNNYIKISDTSDLTANNPDIIYYQTMYNSRVNALIKANKELQAQVDALTQQINEVLNSGNGNIIDSAALQSLIERRSNFQEQIVNNKNDLKIIQGEDGLGGILNHITDELAKGEEAFKADIAFGTTLDEIVTLLENETSTYTSIYKSLYANRFNVNYRNAGIIDTTGGISLIINLAISVVLGLIVGAVVAGIVGYNDTKKDKPKKIKEVELKA